MPKPGGIIYAIGAVGTPWVKIGSTRTNVEERRKLRASGPARPRRWRRGLP
jgi:hypothetical protein